MERLKATENISNKVFLLRQQFKQLQKEERIYKKRNRKLANEIQFQKEHLKRLEDEKVVLQKEIFDQQYNKSVCEENNISLNNHFLSLWKDVNTLQTKITVSWRENQFERYQQSPKKCTSGKFPVPEHLPGGSQPVSTVPIASVISLISLAEDTKKIVNESQHMEQVCKPESMHSNEADLAAAGQTCIQTSDELSCSLNSFCRRNTILLERNRELIAERQLENEMENSEEPFKGFVEDADVTAKFTEIIESLSLTCWNLDKLRDEAIAQSLTLFEASPNVKETDFFMQEAERPKQYNLQEFEVSVPQLNLKPLGISFQSTAGFTELREEESVGRSNKDISQIKKASLSPDSSCKLESTPPYPNAIGTSKVDISKMGLLDPQPCLFVTPVNARSPSERGTLPDSASSPTSKERISRRARSAVVSYKEKRLNVKLRRN